MIEADYLIVGAGAMGMAFGDVLLTETDATLAIVDRYGKPGGHWTRAYPHVHQCTLAPPPWRRTSLRRDSSPRWTA